MMVALIVVATAVANDRPVTKSQNATGISSGVTLRRNVVGGNWPCRSVQMISQIMPASVITMASANNIGVSWSKRGNTWVGQFATNS